jgi:hypothetical protein
MITYNYPDIIWGSQLALEVSRKQAGKMLVEYFPEYNEYWLNRLDVYYIKETMQSIFLDADKYGLFDEINEKLTAIKYDDPPIDSLSDDEMEAYQKFVIAIHVALLSMKVPTLCETNELTDIIYNLPMYMKIGNIEITIIYMITREGRYVFNTLGQYQQIAAYFNHCNDDWFWPVIKIILFFILPMIRDIVEERKKKEGV